MTASRAYAQAAEPSNFFVAGKNKIINGDFNIWQRGTSFATSGYTADRWYNGSNATISFTRETFTPGTAPVAGYESSFFLRQAKSAGGTFTDIRQRIEDVRTFAGQTVTLSFWAKVSTGTASIQPYYVQNFGSGGSAGVASSVTAQTINTSWARYSFTFTLPSISGKTIGTSNFLEIYATRCVTSSAVTIDTWGVQLEAGSVATAFQTATGTLAGELAACQRYFYRAANGANKPIGNTNADTTNLSYCVLRFPVSMRGTPTMSDSNGTNHFFWRGWDGGNYSTITFNTFTALEYASNEAAGFYKSGIVNVGTAASGRFFTNNASSYLDFSAEL